MQSIAERLGSCAQCFDRMIADHLPMIRRVARRHRPHRRQQGRHPCTAGGQAAGNGRATSDFEAPEPEPRGLGRLHHRILYFIGRNRSIAISALLKTLRVSKQALNRPLRQLIEMKLVDVEVPSHDRRVRQHSLTGEGRRLEAQLTCAQVRHLSHAFTTVGADATKSWREVMQRIALSTEVQMDRARGVESSGS